MDQIVMTFETLQLGWIVGRQNSYLIRQAYPGVYLIRALRLVIRILDTSNPKSSLVERETVKHAAEKTISIDQQS